MISDAKVIQRLATMNLHLTEFVDGLSKWERFPASSAVLDKDGTDEVLAAAKAAQTAVSNLLTVFHVRRLKK